MSFRIIFSVINLIISIRFIIWAKVCLLLSFLVAWRIIFKGKILFLFFKCMLFQYVTILFFSWWLLFFFSFAHICIACFYFFKFKMRIYSSFLLIFLCKNKPHSFFFILLIIKAYWKNILQQNYPSFLITENS